MMHHVPRPGLTALAVAGRGLNEVLGHAAQGPEGRRGPGRLEHHRQLPAPFPGPVVVRRAVEARDAANLRRR